MIRGGYDDFETPGGILNPSGGQGYYNPFNTENSFGGGFLEPGGPGVPAPTITYPGQNPGFVPSQFGGPGTAPGGGGSSIGLAPTAAQVAANPGAYAGTSFDPTRTLGGGNVPYDPKWNPLLTPWNTTNPSAANDPMAWVRNLDQITYYKYILPYQQRGGDITNIPEMTRIIQEGMARDGGGQWANGSQVSNVSGPRLNWMQSPTGNASNAPAGISQSPAIGSASLVGNGTPAGGSLSQPHQTFLNSSDPRAAYLRNLLNSGNANEQQAAQRWLHQNIIPGGTAGTPLDNMSAWAGRFNNFFGLTPASGGGSTPNTPETSFMNSGAPGQGQDYSDWYYSAQGPGYVSTDNTGDVQYFQQWSDEVDQWILSQGLLPGQFRNPTPAQMQNDGYLQQLRTALDRARQNFGIPAYSNVAQLATGSQAPNQNWFADQEDLASSPFRPTEDPGPGFQWDWIPGTANRPGQWYRKATQANDYQQYLDQIGQANKFLTEGNKTPIIGSALLGLFGTNNQINPFQMKNGQYSPVAEALFGYNKGFQNPNQLLYDTRVNSQFLNNFNGASLSDIYDPTDQNSVLGAIQQLNALRSQPGYGSVGYTGNTSPASNQNWFLGNTANTPFRPTEAPLEGFKWIWSDPDGSGPLTQNTWMQQQVFNPSNLQEATDFAGRINAYQTNPNASKLMFASNNGTPMFNATQNNNAWNFSVNPNYPTWKPAQTSNQNSAPIIGSSLPNFTFPSYTPSGGGSSSSGSSGSGSTPSPITYSSPFGSMTGRPGALGGRTNFWG